MFLDMHIHTNRYSSCSILDPLDLVRYAQVIRLDGLTVVEHYHYWSREEIDALKEAAQADLLILSGQEVTSSIGHLLLYGYEEKVPENLAVEKIISRVHDCGGAVILAHPFRDGQNLGRPPEELEQIFSLVDGAEVYNANQNIQENEYGRRIWETLGFVGVSGSDAHSLTMVGGCLTWFEKDLRSEAEFLAEIKAGRCKPIVCEPRRRQK